jgi:hypothetical protein
MILPRKSRPAKETGSQIHGRGSWIASAIEKGLTFSDINEKWW